jgi:prepilin-type N-terminal cleavage/methylation domain-containing protein/prepilin-type processing-associated H-X9-DG protein
MTAPATITGRRHHGFTLIELLVVIAIISILAAILFPVFAQARAKSYQVACASNLHQIGIAMLEYAQDYDDMMERGNYNASTWPSDGFTYAGWAGMVDQYAKSPAVFRCPTDSTAPSSINGELATPCTYFLNANFVQDTYPNGVLLTAVTTPSVTVMVAEDTIISGSNDIARIQDPTETDSVVANMFTAIGGSHDRHQGGRNFLLADGHVARLPPATVSTGPDTAAMPASTLATPYLATFNYH